MFFMIIGSSCPLLSQQWQDDYEDAVLLAKEEAKPLIVVFSGSDWCAPCIKLDRDIWQSEIFKNHAAKKYVLYRADFPRKKKNRLTDEKQASNNALAERLNPRGHFPLVLVLDDEEHVMGSTGFKNWGPKKYIALLDSYLK